MGRRKKRPYPPKYFWYDTDGCWFCKKKNACGGCKILKQYIANTQTNSKKKRRETKKFLDNYQNF